MTSKLSTLKETSCDCEECRSMCHRPCWGTPKELKRLIDAGYSDRLMKDYWTEANGERTEILSPALKGHEKQGAPFFPRSEKGCTFWKDGLCELHDLGLKPSEGRLAHHSTSHDKECTLHDEIHQTWDSDEGRALCATWIPKEHDEDPIDSLLSLLAEFCDIVKEKQDGE